MSKRPAVTLKQKRTSEILAAHPQKSTASAMREAGYGPGMVNNSQVLMRSPGFKQALADCGLTEDLVASSLVADIKAKPAKRVEELKLAASILRMTGNASANVAVQVNIDSDREKYA